MKNQRHKLRPVAEKQPYIWVFKNGKMTCMTGKDYAKINRIPLPKGYLEWTRLAAKGKTGAGEANMMRQAFVAAGILKPPS